MGPNACASVHVHPLARSPHAISPFAQLPSVYQLSLSLSLSLSPRPGRPCAQRPRLAGVPAAGSTARRLAAPCEATTPQYRAMQYRGAFQEFHTRRTKVSSIRLPLRATRCVWCSCVATLPLRRLRPPLRGGGGRGGPGVQRQDHGSHAARGPRAAQALHPVTTLNPLAPRRQRKHCTP